MKKTICDYNIDNKKVIIRCDLNVPVKDGVILDDNRIIESLDTIKYALDNNAKVIILSHLGRIKNEKDKKDKSLYIVSKRLSELLNKEVKFVNETRGCVLENEVNNMKAKEVILIENTRFEDYPCKKESSNDDELGKYWASLGDIFINDAFATSHRNHASNVGIASNIPSGVGFLIEKELKMLGNTLNNPQRSYTVIMGGVKINDKIKVVDKLFEKADYVLLAGGIANTFLKAKGYELGKSIYDEESISYVNELMKRYKDKIVLPLDGYGSSAYEDGLDVVYTDINNVNKDIMILDIGEKTIELFKEYVNKSKTVFWNGPVGVSEFKNFEYGTKSIGEILKNSNATVVVGGGDTAGSLIRFGYKTDFAHISTGGGASLEFIEGKALPGISVIDEK